VSTEAGVRAFLETHEPQLAHALRDCEALDFLCLRHYANMVARCWSTERWAIVGIAGAFVDPLYSPGSDFIAFANCFTTELMRRERAGEDIDAPVTQLNIQYRTFVLVDDRALPHGGAGLRHPQAMAAKVYWDNFTYWSYTCQYFQRRLDARARAPRALRRRRTCASCATRRACTRCCAPGPSWRRPCSRAR
jgi:hypothetical protein